MYGLNTKDSDTDHKGIFLPSRRNLILGSTPATINTSTGTPHSRNTSEDNDTELFSLQQFVKLACEGQTCAIEMLYAPEEFWTLSVGREGEIWRELVAERERFLSKKMHSFVGYARAQATKYSLKGERLNKLRAFHEIVNRAAGESGDTPMCDIWDELPRDEERTSPQGVPELQIAGKWFGATTRTGMVAAAVKKTIDRYGARAEAAAATDGKDWKALSHAMRVTFQCQDLMSPATRSIVVPFEAYDREYLMDIKMGRLAIEDVRDRLDCELAELESLAAKSRLPEKVDRTWWDDWLVKTIEEYVL